MAGLIIKVKEERSVKMRIHGEDVTITVLSVKGRQALLQIWAGPNVSIDKKGEDDGSVPTDRVVDGKTRGASGAKVL